MSTVERVNSADYDSIKITSLQRTEAPLLCEGDCVGDKVASQ